MSGFNKISAKISAADFCISQTVVDKGAFFDACFKSECNKVIFLCSGNADFSSGKENIHAECGNMIFLPEACRYVVNFSGNNGIEFYSLEINKASLLPKLSDFPMQIIKGSEADSVEDSIKALFKLSKTDNLSEKIQSASLFYNLMYFISLGLTEQASSKDSAAISKALDYIYSNYNTEFTISQIATYCFLSESRLHHAFTERTGISPLKYRNQVRIGHAANSLRYTDVSVDIIAEQNGFNSTAFFRETFKATTGLAPMEYRRLCKSLFN